LCIAPAIEHETETLKASYLKQFFIYTLLLLNIVVALALAFASVSVYLSPEKIWFAALFGLAYPYLFVINLVFIILWLLIRVKYTLISLVIILAGFNLIGNYLQISGRQTDKKGIKIVSYNVQNFTGTNKFPTKENADHILNFLKESNADIICLQEVRLNKRQIFDIYNNKIPEISHMQLAHTSYEGGQLTLTKYPILNMGEIRFKNSGNMIIFTDVMINTVTVRVYNCHLQSYGLQPAEINAIDSIDFNGNNYDKQKWKGLAWKFKNANIKRAQQAAALREHIDKCRYPVIVCGDFNDTPVSFTYRTVKGTLEDSFIQSGRGTANTYNGKLPSFRIDYILHSPIFESYNFEVSSLNHSDHYPVSCDLFSAGEKE